MEIVDYLLARKKAGGGGSDVTIEQLSITENGTYSEQGIAYSPVVVNVPAPENSYQLTDIPAGTVSTIEDGTDLPMSSLKVGIEPVQDLHGYDHPWAGGAGKNLFHMGSKVNATISNVTYTSDDEYLYLDGTKQGGGYANLSSLQLTLPAGTYYLKAFIISGTSSSNIDIYPYDGETNITSYLTNTERTLTLESEKTFWFRIAIWQDGTVLNNYKIGIVVSDTANIDKFYPYSNICPISGWSAANVTRSGKNLCEMFVDGYVPSINGGRLVLSSGSRSDFIPIVPNTRYTFSVNVSSLTMYIFCYDKDKNFLSYQNGNGAVSYESPANSAFAMLRTSESQVGNFDFQFEKGVRTTYEPYNGTTYNVQFTDGTNPLTVYGGTLDVTTGELVVDRVSVDMGNLSWAYDASYDRFASNDIPNSEPPSGARITAFISSMYEVIDDERPISQVTNGQMYSSFNSTQTNAIVIVHDNRFTDATKFKTAVTGQTFVYELATPLTYQLTPAQVRTLVGTNNIWADTGDILEGKYFKEL